MTRRRTARLLVGALALGTLGTLPLAGSASAEPTFTPQPGDVVGVGSDTTQFALDYLADGATVNGVPVAGYNVGKATGRIATFDAIGDGLSANITPKQGAAEIVRPNGSGAGKGLLYGGVGNTGNTAIDFARSSSALNTTEVSNNLWAVPFAVDGLKLAVKATGSNAPAFVTPAQLVSIYKGETTNWNQVGGGNGTIVPLIPQSGSGTRSFFTAQLQAANGGVAVVLGPNVVETQEHDDSLIKNDANAVAPFSTGRAKPLTTITLLGGSSVGGFEAKRALYDVVRQADLTASWFAPIFGSAGFLCSPAGRPLIEKAGFDQLATPANGGVCGSATQAATTDFDVNTSVVDQPTSTTLQVTTASAKVTLRATVAAPTGTPEGTVEFFDGATSVGTTNLAGGVGLVSVSGVAAGAHSYSAVYTSTNAAFADSTSAASNVTVVVPKASKTTVALPAKAKLGATVKATVTVKVGAANAKGKVKAFKGSQLLATGKLVKGKVVLSLKGLRKGRQSLTFTYLGNATTARSQVAKVIKIS